MKRVVGLPGEEVQVKGGRVFVNGTALGEPYRTPTGEEVALARRDGAWSLSVDEYFLLGDNRQDSLDSRAFGPVPRASVLGRVWYRSSQKGRTGIIVRP